MVDGKDWPHGGQWSHNFQSSTNNLDYWADPDDSNRVVFNYDGNWFLGSNGLPVNNISYNSIIAGGTCPPLDTWDAAGCKVKPAVAQTTTPATTPQTTTPPTTTPPTTTPPTTTPSTTTTPPTPSPTTTTPQNTSTPSPSPSTTTPQVTTTPPTPSPTTPEQTTTSTTPWPYPECPPKGTFVQWKGAKVSKVVFYSEHGALMRVNFFNNGQYDLRSQEYLGFLAFTKKKCARDFTDALVDGRVTIAAYDYEPIYLNPHVYQRVDGRHTSTVFQFNRLLSSSNRDLGNFKKDQFYLTLEGLNNVDFGNNNMKTCLEAVVAGTFDQYSMNINPLDNYAYCAAYDKDLGW